MVLETLNKLLIDIFPDNYMCISTNYFPVTVITIQPTDNAMIFIHIDEILFCDSLFALYFSCKFRQIVLLYR